MRGADNKLSMSVSFQSPQTASADILIAGAGIIGLSLALELHSRGARVTVLERDTALSHASTAAAGMLAAEDPHNPPALLPFCRWSLTLYPAYLSRIEALVGERVPYQTSVTWQYSADGYSTRLAEHSVDPRQLAAALLAAIRATTIDLREQTPLDFVEEKPHGILAHTSASETIYADHIIHTTGAWAGRNLALPITPCKGQMLRVDTKDGFADEAHRSEAVYALPRTQGPHANTLVIGATVEDAGFDCTTHPAKLNQLRALAAALHPSLAFVRDAEQIEAWAGLRPATPDGLPFLGALTLRQTIASGHYRNGILLAPATSQGIADLLQKKSTGINLAPFSPFRFAAQSSHSFADNRPTVDDNAFAHLR
jgi:glycine oxidase